MKRTADEKVYNLVKEAYDPYNVEKLNEIRDKYGVDLYKEALIEIQKEQNEITENLWIYACTGEIEKLRSYYENGGKIGRRYEKFGKSHSLIAGAYRNGDFDTVRYLLEVGETLEKHETDIDLNVLHWDTVIEVAENLVSYFKYHNKNLTKAQDGKIEDLAEALRVIGRKI